MCLCQVYNVLHAKSNFSFHRLFWDIFLLFLHLCVYFCLFLLSNNNIFFKARHLKAYKSKQIYISKFFIQKKTRELFSLTIFYTFDSIEAATRVRDNLNGCDIYSGCCTLKIDFAKVSGLLISFVKSLLLYTHIQTHYRL